MVLVAFSLIRTKHRHFAGEKPAPRTPAAPPAVDGFCWAVLRCGLKAREIRQGYTVAHPASFVEPSGDGACVGLAKAGALQSLGEVGGLLLAATSADEFRCAWSVLAMLLAQVRAADGQAPSSLRAGARKVIRQFSANALSHILAWRWTAADGQPGGTAPVDLRTHLAEVVATLALSHAVNGILASSLLTALRLALRDLEMVHQRQGDAPSSALCQQENLCIVLHLVEQLLPSWEQQSRQRRDHTPQCIDLSDGGDHHDDDHTRLISEQLATLSLSLHQAVLAPCWGEQPLLLAHLLRVTARCSLRPPRG